VEADSICLDTLSIVPLTFQINGITVSDYRLDNIKAILYWKKKPITDSITITYRVFPVKFDQYAQNMVYDSVVYKFYTKPFEFNADYSN